MQGPASVAEGVHRLGTGLVNWYLVEEAGRLTFVDSGVPGYYPLFEAALSGLGRSPGDVVEFVIS
jgi:hypothetical protein